MQKYVCRKRLGVFEEGNRILCCLICIWLDIFTSDFILEMGRVFETFSLRKNH